MKKVKIITIFLLLFMLTGCSSDGKSANSRPTNSSIVQSQSNSIDTLTIQPYEARNTETPKSKIEPPKPKETLNGNESKNVPKNNIKEINGFVLLSSLDKDIVIDLKYATADNFTKKIIYPNKVCVLRNSTAAKLVKANTELKKLGYRIKVWDGYRPVYVQQIFWDIVKDSRFVANPKNGGSIHNRGCAVDVTLVDKDGNDVTMPSKFDDFSYNANRTNSKITKEAKKNMDLLTKYMVDNGFKTINTEWWHFDDVDSKNYKIINIDLNLFLENN